VNSMKDPLFSVCFLRVGSFEADRSVAITEQQVRALSIGISPLDPKKAGFRSDT
jgi:hypothetical protein